MSITQEYERFRKQIGNKKYDALEHYIDTHGKIEEWEQGVKDIRKIEDIKLWEEEYHKLHQRCKPIFIEDVSMSEEEWNKFEKWYKENYEKKKTHKEREVR